MSICILEAFCNFVIEVMPLKDTLKEMYIIHYINFPITPLYAWIPKRYLFITTQIIREVRERKSQGQLLKCSMRRTRAIIVV